MRGPTGNRLPRACVIAESPLAEAYLRQLLAKGHVLTIPLEQLPHLPPSKRTNTVFVIDRFGLELPLSECLRRLVKRFPDARFLVLDQERSTDEIVGFLIMGAHGYVTHDQVLDLLPQAIFHVAAARLWVPVEAFQAFLCEAGSVLHKRHLGGPITTPREHEIVELVRRRLSNREIAELLQIRLSTVKFHISNILSKMDLGSRQDLTEIPSPRMRILLE